MQKGNIVEFKHKSTVKLGTLESPEGKSSWIIQDERGHSFTIAQRDITFVLPNHTLTGSSLPSFLEKSQNLETAAELELAWEILEGQKTVTLEEMCNLLYSEVTPEGLWAARQVLTRDRIWFKEKSSLYEVRERAHAEELKRALNAEESRAQASKELLERWMRKQGNQEVLWTADDLARIDALKAFVLFAEEAPGKNQAIKTLELFSRPGTPESAFKLLVDQGIWSPHENLGIHRRNIQLDFTPEELSLVQNLSFATTPDEDAKGRKNLTTHKIFTIDSDSTVEIDDGLSLETLDSGSQKIWIHIADPGRLILKGSGVDALAQRRSTSIYLPTGMIPMLPLELTAGPLSLNQGQDTPSLSFGVEISEDGNILTYEILPSLIRPARRLTYLQADRLLADDPSEPDLRKLSELAQLRRKWRETRGAVFFRLPEIEPVVQGSVVTLEPIADTPSRQLVSEMMVLAGEIAGRFGAEKQLALPYRGQNPPEGDLEGLNLLPEGPARDYARRRMMPRSTTMTAPLGHYSLGLESYVQVTSPLRRYNDLLAHYQIKAALRGSEVPFTAETLGEILPQSQEAATNAAGLERETSKYWRIEYLRKHAGVSHKAVVLGVVGQDEKAYQIIFWDLGLEWIFKSPKPLQLGQTLMLKVKVADPRLERLVLIEA